MDEVVVLVVLLIVELILIIAISVGLYEKSTNAICLSRKRLDGKTVIVTGGTAGLGLRIAKDIADRGARVIIACPFEEEGLKAREKIINDTENEKVIYKYLDLGSLTSVRKFSTDILNTESRLDILVNNAGVGVPADIQTEDDMHFIMQVNYYGTFLLTMLLLPLLKKSGTSNDPSRILATTSCFHNIGKVDIDNANRTNHWYKVQLYANSKLYLLYFANELTNRLQNSNVVINNVDPGVVGTRIYSSLNKLVGAVVTFLILMFFKTPWQGAQTALHVALDKSAGKVSGAYFRNCQMKRAARRAYCEKATKAVWEHSIRITKLSEGELLK